MPRKIGASFHPHSPWAEQMPSLQQQDAHDLSAEQTEPRHRLLANVDEQEDSGELLHVGLL